MSNTVTWEQLNQAIMGSTTPPKHQLDLYSKIRRKANLESSISNGYSDYTTQLVTVNQNDFI